MWFLLCEGGNKIDGVKLILIPIVIVMEFLNNAKKEEAIRSGIEIWSYSISFFILKMIDFSL